MIKVNFIPPGTLNPPLPTHLPAVPHVGDIIETKQNWEDGVLLLTKFKVTSVKWENTLELPPGGMEGIVDPEWQPFLFLELLDD